MSSGPIRTPHPAQSSLASAKSEPRDASAVNSGRPEWPDYSKGPSALDKASQLFFFTEIVRGMLNLACVGYGMDDRSRRSVQIGWKGE